ncbi:unnamed protein product [Alopecurus aequalis]
MTESEGAEVMRRRRRRCSGTLPDDDDMLREILLRLPPQPSSLPLASAVCKRWLEIVTDPKFLRLFRAHHRKPPVLGVFVASDYGMVFKSILDPPDRIPAQRFDLARYSGVGGYSLLDCRHGCLLYKLWAHQEVFVVDPMTGQHRRLVAPPEFVNGRVDAAVLCAAGDQGHVHGGCRLSSYKVVLLSVYRSNSQPLACVYSLGTGQWSHLISTVAPCQIYDVGIPATLVGNVLYWLFRSDPIRGSGRILGSIDRILEFDLDKQNIVVTVGPTVRNDFLHGRPWIIRAEDGAVRFAIGMSIVIVLPHGCLGRPLKCITNNVYALQLKSMQSKKLYGTNCINQIHPFTSFYTPALNDGSNGAEMLHDT